MAEFRFTAVGKCIYCGFADGQLSDEHIIPFALGGKYVLPKASCHKCAQITSRIERTALRETLLPLRMLFGLPTRRPALRPTNLKVDLEMANGEERTIKIKIDEHPAVISLIALRPARILMGLPPNDDGKYDVTLWTHMDIPEVKKLLIKYQAKRCAFYSFKWRLIKWEQLFAKIGYAWAVANADDDFEPLAPELILRDAYKHNYLVGSQLDFDMSSFVGDDFFQLSSKIYKKNGLVVAAMRFVPNLEGPIYHVVVGRDCQKALSARQDGSDQ